MCVPGASSPWSRDERQAEQKDNPHLHVEEERHRSPLQSHLSRAVDPVRRTTDSKTTLRKNSDGTEESVNSAEKNDIKSI